jgi:hypothetical protein
VVNDIAVVIIPGGLDEKNDEPSNGFVIRAAARVALIP